MADDKIKVEGPQYRAERITAHHLSAVSFSIESEAKFAELPLINISLSGVAADLQGLQGLPELGQPCRGLLVLNKQSTPIEIIVRRKTDEVIAGEFIDPEKTLAEKLREFFAAEISGARLKLAEVGEQDFEYTDGFDVKLTYTLNDEIVVRFRFELWGNVIDFEKGQLRHGRYLDFRTDAKVEPQLLVFSEDRIEGITQFAQQMLTQIEKMDQAIKFKISNLLKRTG